MRNENAIPFDIPNVELGHHGDECSFDSIIKKYELDKMNPELLILAENCKRCRYEKRHLTPQSAGLAAIAAGFHVTSKDDYENMEKQFSCIRCIVFIC